MDTSVFNRIVRDIKDKNEDDEYKLISFGDGTVMIFQQKNVISPFFMTIYDNLRKLTKKFYVNWH